MSNRHIIRTVKDGNNPYFMCSRALMQDERLSLEARGLLGYLLSKPDNWEVWNTDLARTGKMGEHRLARILRELKTVGYMTRERKRNAQGQIEWETLIFETPRAPYPENRGMAPYPDYPSTDQPSMANRGIYIRQNGHNTDRTEERETPARIAASDVSRHTPNSNGSPLGGYDSSTGRHTNARPVAAEDPPPVVVRVPAGTPVNRRPDAPPMRPQPKPERAPAQLAKWRPPEDFAAWYAETCAERGCDPAGINVTAELQKFRAWPAHQEIRPGQFAAAWQMWILRALDGMGQPRGSATPPGKAPPRRRSVDEVEDL